VALATFALQLDAFEARIKVRPAKPHIEMAKLFSVDVAKSLRNVTKNTRRG
jgi:hypothetical protein